MLPLPNFTELFYLTKSIIQPLLPLIYLILAVNLGFYLLEWLIDLLFLLKERKKERKKEKEKEEEEKRKKEERRRKKEEEKEIKLYGKVLTEKERLLLWFYKRAKGEI